MREVVTKKQGSDQSVHSRRAFTLVELLVVIGIIGLLMSILLPAMSRAREQANVVKCASNLRQIALAMIAYSANERNHGFPRTIFKSKSHLQLDNAGFGVPDTFGNSGYVGENNVPASLYLLMRTQGLPPAAFICPSSNGQPGFRNGGIEGSSNWEQIPENLSYSMATPFPSPAAEASFVWRDAMAPEFALAADINPGTRGSGPAGPNNVVGPRHDAAAAQLAAANSNNHRNKGQNVVYTDAHVEFQTTPYCGARREADGIRDHIYTAGAGDNGFCDDTALPVDPQDSVLLPTDDPGGK